MKVTATTSTNGLFFMSTKGIYMYNKMCPFFNNNFVLRKTTSLKRSPLCFHWTVFNVETCTSEVQSSVRKNRLLMKTTFCLCWVAFDAMTVSSCNTVIGSIKGIPHGECYTYRNHGCFHHWHHRKCQRHRRDHCEVCRIHCHNAIFLLDHTVWRLGKKIIRKNVFMSLKNRQDIQWYNFYFSDN